MRKINPREIIGRKYKCDTKNGKKCQPVTIQGWFSNDVRCKHCQRLLKKPRN